MKKMLLILPSLLLNSLYANYLNQEIFFFKEQIPTNLSSDTTYRIKIGAFSYLKNAQNAQSLTPFKSYIIKGQKYHSLYIGTYHDRDEALSYLHKIAKTYHDAYLVTTYGVKEIKRVLKKQDFFKEAKRYFERGDYESALALYDKEMILHPNNHQAALEYARTLYMLGFYKQSKEAFLKVLAIDPPQNVRKNIDTFLALIDDALSSHSFYGSLMIGLSYDNNLGYNPSMPTTLYGGIELENNTTKTKGLYNNVNLLIAHRYERENFTWDNSFYTYNEFQHENEIADVNFINFTTRLSKRYGAFNIALPLSSSYTWFAQESDNYALSTLPSVTFKTSKTSYISLAAKYYQAFNQKSKARSFKTIGTHLLFSKFYEKFSFRTSIAYEKDEKIEGKRFDVAKKNLYANGLISYAIFNETLLSAYYQYEKNDYSDIDPALVYAREDIKELLSLAIKKYFDSHNALSLRYNNLKNDSNINSYSYKKQTYSLNYHYDF